MSLRLKIFFMALMTLALAFGFLNALYPAEGYSFARLHIFLFNLCTGCTILLYFSEPYRNPSPRVLAFLFLTLTYAVSAFLEIYLPVVLVTPVLVAIVERIRIKRFSFFPWDFFSSRTPVSAKFHQAALLCLSMGLTIAGLVILNNEYYLVLNISKLNLNVFFLGFSFPLTLITMSLIFSIMEEDGRQLLFRKNLAFWLINLGVITFFIFILAQLFIPQVLISLVLFGAVLLVFHMFAHMRRDLQQKRFLISGMGFLMITAITGVLYIMLEFSPGYRPESVKWILQLHAFTSLYGWNLCGLAIICRFYDFPIRLHSTMLIVLHWMTVLILAPLGCYFPGFSVLALAGYTAFLGVMLFSQATRKAPAIAEKVLQTRLATAQTGGIP